MSTGIETIVANASGALAAQWDGTRERVGCILEQAGGAAVGFLTRAEAIARLEHFADEAKQIEVQVNLRVQASSLAEAAPLGKIQCLVMGWGGIALVAIPTSELRRARTDVAPDRILAQLLEACGRQSTAHGLVAAARATFAIGAPETSRQLGQIEAAIDAEWDDTAKIATKIAEALVGLRRHMGPDADRARTLLNALAQATSDRAREAG